MSVRVKQPDITDFDHTLHAIRADHTVTRRTCETHPCLLEPLSDGPRCYYHAKLAAGLLTPFGGMVNRKGN